MKINIHEIEADEKELAYDEPTSELNPVLENGAVHDFDFPAALHVAVKYYRAGQELFFNGTLCGPVVGHCGRCLEDFLLDVNRDFTFVMVPHDDRFADAEASEDGLNLTFYHGEQIDLSPLVREQILLALPTRALCSEDCQGLCPHCGGNLNRTSCNCAAEATGDFRLAALRGLKVHH